MSESDLLPFAFAGMFPGMFHRVIVQLDDDNATDARASYRASMSEE